MRSEGRVFIVRHRRIIPSVPHVPHSDRPRAGRTAQRAPASFVIAGSGESVEGKANYRDHIVSPGDTSPAGMLAKARWVLDEMERRMSAFGGDWKQTTSVQLYTVQDVFPILENELGRRGVFRNGLTWHFNRPPVVGLEYEMDCRCVQIERVV